ncbi:MAG: ABC transporter substrate-binding protein [Firmicutes bacterium]|nr:ABC transporter substrate-binding protein [Bacillota bacterium]
MTNRKLTVSLLFVVLLCVLSFGAAAQEEPRVATWIDEAILIEEPSVATAISRLQAGDIDLWAYTSSDVTGFNAVLADPNLDFYRAFGSYSEITYNTVGPNFNDGRLNPLSNRRIREATNMMVDRDYIAQEIYGGLAIPKYTLLNSSFVDYSRVVEKVRELELKYAPNLELADEIISEEMIGMGAERIDGIWHYQGEPIELLILARSEDERAPLGEYIAEQFEKIGFKTVVDYRTGGEASPVWMMGDPWLGKWHVYTGGWSAPMVYRDQGHIFNQMYTRRTMSQPVFQALEPIPELDEISDRLYRKQYTSMEERKELFERALELAFQDSPRIFIVDKTAFVPRRADINVASDLAGQVSGTALWPSTIRRGDEVGGRVVIAQPQVLVEPWNPVAGSNWTFDQTAIRATMDRGIVADPYTGNYWGHRIDRTEVYVKEGLPVEKTLDWVSLEFVPEIQVPEDAWTDWDPVEQRFITVGEKYPEGLTCLRKSVVYYPENFYEIAKWHDGSPVSLGDFVFWFILEFDRGMEESLIFDESAVAGLDTLRASFRGWKITSQDPLIFEYYSDSWSLDAESMAADLFPVEFNYGKAPWHTLALGMLAEMNGELAFSVSKANKLEAEWLGFHSGPSLPILAKHLDEAIADGYIPYAKFLDDYISEEEMQNRYANAKRWYEEKGHFWIGDGPMYLEKVYPVEKIVHLKRNTAYSEPADKWSMFDEPRIADVVVSGPARVKGGETAVFEVDVTFKDEPYALDDMKEVKFIVLDASGNVALSGFGEGMADGKFEIVLSEEETKNLPVGSNTLEVIALPKLVGGATFGQHTFVTLP